MRETVVIPARLRASIKTPSLLLAAAMMTTALSIAAPLPAFAHGLVGQADQMKARHPRRDLTLHFDGARLKPQIGDGRDQRDQCSSSPRSEGALMAEGVAPVERPCITAANQNWPQKKGEAR